MVLETTKNKIILNQLVGQKKEKHSVENDVIVSDIKPDVLNVISTNGIINIYKKEVLNGKIKIEGSISTYIIYMADDEQGSTRSINTSLDFTQVLEMENAKENMEAVININIKNFETKVINGRKLSVKANIETNASVYSNESLDIITGVKDSENMQVLNNQQKIISLIGSGRNRVTVKDTVAVDIADDIAEIMKVNFKIIDGEIKISYNKVLSKAEAVVEIMYLTEDNKINTVTTKMPIMGFVDIQNVNENSECEASNTLSNLVVKPNNTEEHSIYVEAEIEVSASAYEENQIDIIEDLYSIADDVKFDQMEVLAITDKNRIKDTCTIQENIRIPELTGKVLDVQVSPEIDNMQVKNGKVIYEGTVNLEITFEQNTGLNMRTMNIPFNYEVNSERIVEKSNLNTSLEIKQNDFIIKDGSIQITIGISFDISEQKSKEIGVIENVSVEQSQNCNMYSMIIYFIKPGDTLWKIAKMFRSTVEDIAKVNDIEDPNKIRAGEKIYIPRYCKKQVLA